MTQLTLEMPEAVFSTLINCFHMLNGRNTWLDPSQCVEEAE